MPGSARTVSLAVALACLAAACGAPSALAAEKAIWGPVELTDGQSAFPLYARAGVDTFQIQLRWERVATRQPESPTDPADPAYAWPADLDRAMAEGRRHGVDVSLLVMGTPGWANGGRSFQWVPNEPRAFADFLSAAARRYPEVRRWQIWGEPNMGQNLQPNRPDDPIAARSYAPLLDAAYGALKRASRRNIVVGGMTWSSGDNKPADFLRDLRLPNGRPPRLDEWGHNPFPYRFPDLGGRPAGATRDFSDLDTFSAEVQRTYRRIGRGDVKLWLSEYGIQSNSGSDVFPTFVSRDVQARYVTAAYRIADRLADDVSGLGWFRLTDRPVEGRRSVNLGLLTSDLMAKPSFRAFSRAPSVRHAPRVTHARSISRRSLGGRGLAVRIRPRTSGRVSVQLRRGPRILRVVRTSGSRRAVTVRVRRSGARAGRYQLRVVSSRGETRSRDLRVR